MCPIDVPPTQETDSVARAVQGAFTAVLLFYCAPVQCHHTIGTRVCAINDFAEASRNFRLAIKTTFKKAFI